MIELDNVSVVDARFLNDDEINAISSITIVSRGNGKSAIFELDNGSKTSIQLFPSNSLQEYDTLLPEQVVFINVYEKDSNFFNYYVWRYGDEFPYELMPKDNNSNRILNGLLNREEFYREIEEEKREEALRKEEIRRQEEVNKLENVLNKKESRINDALPIMLGILVGSLFLFAIVYFGAIKQEEGFFEAFCCLLFALFLVPMLLLCKHIWKKLNVYSVFICIVLSFTMSVISYRGINNVGRGNVHKEHFINNSHHSSASKNGFVGGVDPFPNENVDVYVTRYGNCYHSTQNCYEITKSKYISKISKKKAKKRGYVPCSACYGTY